MTKDEIIDHCDLTFDPGDPLNGSLYLCQARGTGATDERDRLVGELRGAGLWSSADLKQVPDEQRAAYRDQLEFVEAQRYDIAGATVTLARFDHPKFPSSAARFDEWKAAFDAHYARSKP